jgi:hypothetical protein
MSADVATTNGMVRVGVEEPTPCAMEMEAGEAIDLAQQLIAAAVDAQGPAGSPMPPVGTRTAK